MSGKGPPASGASRRIEGGIVDRPAFSASERDFLSSAAGRLGVRISEAAIDDLERYVRELETWSLRLNLVAFRDRQDLLERHVVDSLAAAGPLADLGPAISVADLGSGAGFPGVPLAICLDLGRMVLVEPRRRRASFLRSAARLLPERRIEVAGYRAEELDLQEWSGFDAIVTRATFQIPDLLSTAEPLLRPGGLLIAFRGPAFEGEGAPSTSTAPGTDDSRWTRLEDLSYTLSGRAFRLARWRACPGPAI